MRRLRRVLVPEYKGEDEAQQQGIAGKDEPDACPVLDAIHGEMIHDPACAPGAQPGADAIGHDHEQPLSAGPDPNGRFPFDEQGAGDIEKVKGHAVYDHGEQEEDKAAAGIADGEKSKAKDPGEDAHQHYSFDAKSTKEKRDREDEQGLRDLGDGGQQVRVPDSKRVRIVGGEIIEEGQTEGIGDLQGGAQEHGEYEKDGHTFGPE